MQRHLHDHLIAVAALAVIASLAVGCGERRTSPAANHSSLRQDGVLILGTTAETPPFSYVDPESGEIVGIEVDIARTAAAKLGCSFETRRMRFENLLFAVKSGEVDMSASAISITEPRKRDVDFSIPYANDGGMFLYRAGERMPTMILAETMRVAVMEATTYDYYLCSHGIDPVRFDSVVDAFEAVKDQRVDAFLNDGIVVLAAVEASGGTLAASRMETRENFGIAVRKDMPQLKAALDEVIREMREAK